MLWVSCSISCRSDRTEWNACNNGARNSFPGAIGSRPPAAQACRSRIHDRPDPPQSMARSNHRRRLTMQAAHKSDLRPAEAANQFTADLGRRIAAPC